MGQGVFVALGAQAADDADGEIREVGMLTERFPGVNIGQMHFDEGDHVEAGARMAILDAQPFEVGAVGGTAACRIEPAAFE